MEQNFQLSTTDTIVVVAYFIIMVGLGILLSKKSENAEDYFLAGRGMRWPVIGFSLFASNISSTTLIGLSGAAYVTGISVFNYEWMAALVLVFFAIFMLPFILKARIYTMPEYLERRYDHRVRMYLAIITLFLNIVVETAGSLYAGGLVAKMIFPDIPMWQTIAVLAVFAGGYTILGGLSAVMITDVIQAVLLLIASAVITWIAFDKAGGIVGGGYFDVLAAIEPGKLSLVRPLDDPAVPWLGLLTGVPLLGFYFWCTNQFMVQRLLSSKDEVHGRKGALFAGFIKLPVLFIMVLPGTAAIILYPGLENGDLVYPTLIFELLPVGIIGLVIAGFLAALMSQIDSTLNSASTLVTMDFVRRYKPELDNRQLMTIGKITTFCMMLFAVVWAPFIESFGSLFAYLQTVFAYCVPPSVAMFIMGMFWKRGTAQGAFATMIVGTLVGVLLFVFNEIYSVLDLHFLYIVPILTIASCATMVLVSLASPPPASDKVEAYTWTKKYYDEETAALKGLPWYHNYRTLSLVLIALTVILVVTWW